MKSLYLASELSENNTKFKYLAYGPESMEEEHSVPKPKITKEQEEWIDRQYEPIRKENVKEIQKRLREEDLQGLELEEIMLLQRGIKQYFNTKDKKEVEPEIKKLYECMSKRAAEEAEEELKKMEDEIDSVYEK